MNFSKVWLGFLLSCTIMTPVIAEPQLMDKVAVVVNKGVILESEISAFMAMVKLDMAHEGQQLPDDATLRRQVREQLIMESIQLQIAAQMGLTVSEAELNRGVAHIAAQNHLSSDQWRQQIIAQGFSDQSYRAQIRKELLANKVRHGQVRQRINVAPQEVDALVKQIAQKMAHESEFELRHILLGLPDNPTAQQVEQQRQLAQRVVNQLRQGVNFAQLSMTYSSDPQALKGGKLGWAKLEALPTIFAEKLQDAKKGSLIGPFQTGVGFHILRVDDIRSPKNPPVVEWHARHILLRSSPLLTDAQAKAKLAQWAQHIERRKVQFADLARQHSQDPGSAAQGGDLGWADPAVYAPSFRTALLRLKPHQLSQPVHTAFGWHLIELLGVRRVDRTEAAQKEQAEQMILSRKFAEEAQNWLQKQRAASYVKILSDDK